MSLYQMATFGGMALGSWIWGVVAEGYGPGKALLASAALMLVGAALGLCGSSCPTMPRSTSIRSTAGGSRSLALDLKPRSGPIVIMIEYIIREENLHDFLDAMAERRRIRRRDGARHWTLTRDLENPEIWIETYHTPTWIEYIRHNQRMTHADAVVSDKHQATAQRDRAAARAPHDRASDRLVGVAGPVEADGRHPRLVVARPAGRIRRGRRSGPARR